MMLVLISFFDLLKLRIPNLAILVLLGAFPFYGLWAGLSAVDFLIHFAVAFACFFAFAVLFYCHIMGGGDVKLIAAIALWLGFPHVFPFLLATALAGGGLAVFSLLFRIAPDYWLSPFPFLARLKKRWRHIPYGIAISIGGILTFYKITIAS
ncbi:MAG: A24 family peptidase [Parvibaculales bacterium]